MNTLYFITIVITAGLSVLTTMFAPRIIRVIRQLKTCKKHLNQRVDWLEEQIEIMNNVVHNRERNQRDKIRKEVNLYLEELKND